MITRAFSKREKTAVFLLFFANVLLLLAIWMDRTYDQVDFDQLLFQMKSTSKGVNTDLLGSALLSAGLIPLALTALEVWIYHLLTSEEGAGHSALLKLRHRSHSFLSVFIREHILSMVSVVLAASLLICGAQTHVFAFMRADSSESEFIRQHYTEPDQTVLHFPEQKRNLVYIFLESMENTYADPSAGEIITECFIPELRSLAEQNLNFSHTADLGGALPYSGTTWTAAAMVAQTAGVPVKVSLAADAYGADGSFLPGAVSIGQLLEEQGYTQVLLLGSNAEFHGREAYFTEHGHYEIVDTESLKSNGRLPKDYEAWWGFEDEKLFSYAREELTRLGEAGAPFNFTMLTADTHFPDGCQCRLCRDDYDEQYANVLACSSRQVAEFVTWIQEQPFYENTTIVISGDHLTMDGGFMEKIDPDFTRTVYNCLINAAAVPAREKDRQFGTFDMYPTTLAALGVTIDGDRLALGTNLFSDLDTLTEQYGYEYLSEELQKQSEFYDSQLLWVESSVKAA